MPLLSLTPRSLPCCVCRFLGDPLSDSSLPSDSGLPGSGSGSGEEEHCEDFGEDHCEEHGCHWHVDEMACEDPDCGEFDEDHCEEHGCHWHADEMACEAIECGEFDEDHCEEHGCEWHADEMACEAGEGGHDHDHDHEGGEMCACLSVEEEHPFGMDCNDADAITASAVLLATCEQSETGCEDYEVDGVHVCQAAFFHLNFVHGWCDHDALMPEQEDLIHVYDDFCASCSIEAPYNEAQPMCPTPACDDPEPALAAAATLFDACTPEGGEGSCCGTTDVIEAFHVVLAYHDFCDHDVYPEEVEEALHDFEEGCEEHHCNTVEPGYDGTICVEDEHCDDFDEDHCEEHGCHWHADEMACEDPDCGEFDEDHCEEHGCHWHADEMACEEIGESLPPWSFSLRAPPLGRRKCLERHHPWPWIAVASAPWLHGTMWLVS